MMNKIELEQNIMARLAEASDSFKDLCDAVQICVSYMVEDKTYSRFWGAGNWHARRAVTQEWVERDIGENHERGADVIKSLVRQEEKE